MSSYEPGYPQQTRPMSDIEREWLEKNGHLLKKRSEGELPPLATREDLRPDPTPEPLPPTRVESGGIAHAENRETRVGAPSSDLLGEITRVLAENGVGQPTAELHGWRCQHPEVYGECSCLEDLVNDLADLLGGSVTPEAVRIPPATLTNTDEAEDWLATVLVERMRKLNVSLDWWCPGEEVYLPKATRPEASS